MTTEYLEYLLPMFKTITVILGVVLLISVFSYTANILVTRKTLILSFVCFTLFMISLWVTAALTDSTVAIPALVCFSGVIIWVGFIFAIKYSALPHVKDLMESKKTKRS